MKKLLFILFLLPAMVDAQGYLAQSAKAGVWGASNTSTPGYVVRPKIVAPSAFAHHRAYGIPSGTVSSTLTNFTVAISDTVTSMKTVANGGSMTNSSANDLVVSSDSNGTSLLKWEIEKYVGTSGNYVLHTLVSSIPSGSATTIYVCWGNSAIATFQGGAAGSAWDANTVQVNHMNQVITAATQTETDYSGNANALTSVGTGWSSSNTVAGIVGDAIATTNAIGNGKYFTMPTWTLSGDFTFSVWMSIANTANNGAFGIGASGGPQNTNFFNSPSPFYRLYSGSADMVTDATATVVNTWTHFVITRSGSNLIVYHNGVQTATGTSSASVTFNQWGRSSTNTSDNESTDELIRASVARSGAWVDAQYKNDRQVWPTKGVVY